MLLCKLCLTNEATQTGSHIVSAFYIKPVVGGRGKEVSHAVTSDPSQDYTKDEGDSFVKEDFILCTDCEKRLSYVEAHVSEEFSNKFRKENFAQNFKETPIRARNRLTLVEPVRLNPFAYQIFVYSIVWRASISNSPISEGFSLASELEENIRHLLNEAIPPSSGYRGVLLDKRQWFSTLAQDFAGRFEYPFVVVSPQSPEPFGTGFISFFKGLSKPYSVIIGDSIIYFDCHQEYTQDTFKILNRVNREAFYNQGGNPIRILIISDSFWAQTRKLFIRWIVRARAYNFYKSAEEKLIREFGGLPKGYKHLNRIAYSIKVQREGL